MSFLIQASYFVAAVLFILGLKRMASPRTAVSGIKWAGIGMVLAVVATFFYPDLHNIGLIVTAIVIGGAAAWISGKKVEMTDMPQMVALYNGMGGGAAGAISAVELYSGAATSHGAGLAALAVIGEALSAERDLSLPGFGKLKIKRSKTAGDRRVIEARIRQDIAPADAGSVGNDGVAEQDD